MRALLPRYLSDVLILLVEGYRPQEIARVLSLSEDSTRTYIKRILKHFEDEPELQDARLAPRIALVLIGQRYLRTALYDALPTDTALDGVFNSNGLAVKIADLPREDYEHIEARMRPKAFTGAARLINSLVPADEKRRKKLRRVNSFSTLEASIAGLNAYVDHDTDHAVMLLLDWMRENDSARWQDLHRTLGQLVDICYRQAQKSGLDRQVTRTLNTVLCYAHRFGPPILADKVINAAIHLWEAEPGQASAYIFRDILHCDLFCARPMAQDRFNEFLARVFASPTEGGRSSAEQVIPLLEILYFSTEGWGDGAHIHNAPLLPDERQLSEMDISRALQQTMHHLNKPGLPALSQANYQLVAIKLLEASHPKLFNVLNEEIVGDMENFAALPSPSEFRGNPLLTNTWNVLRRHCEIDSAAWAGAKETFSRGLLQSVN